MRSLCLAMLVLLLPGFAAAAPFDADVAGLFSANLLTRLQSQSDFLAHWRNDEPALNALVDRAITNSHNGPAVYDALSILARAPVGLRAGNLRAKALKLAEIAANNSVATGRVASIVYNQFEGGTLVQSNLVALVNGLFSAKLTDRLEAQTAFFNEHISNISDVNLLVDTSLDNTKNVPGIYDALSLLDRVPAIVSTNADLRPKTLKLAEITYGNSAATALVASRVHVRFGGGALTAAANAGGAAADLALTLRVTGDLQSQSFSDFKQDTAGLTFDQVQASIATPITKPQFDAIVASSRNFYSNLPVISTVQVPTPDGSGVISFDCVPQDHQPMATRTGTPSIPAPVLAPLAPAKPPHDPDAALAPSNTASATAAAPPPTPTLAPEVVLAQNGGPECAAGNVPIPRVSVGEAVAISAGQPSPRPILDMRTLRSVDGMDTTAPATPFAHHYAHAATRVENHGAASTLNVWSPHVLPGDMSLSQIWVVGIDAGSNTLQTVEAGWQVMSLWHTPFATTFVYSTSDQYVNTGCYATRCSSNLPARAESFVLTSNKVIIGAPVATNGAGAMETIKIFRNPDTGDWWVAVNGEWVGYYPEAFFNDGPLAHGANYIDFGGETAGLSPSAEMGSGRYAEEGFGVAAFQSGIHYFDVHDRPVAPTLDPSESDAECYSVAVNKPAAPSTAFGTFIFFGGPGTRHFQPAAARNSGEACHKVP